MPTVTFCIPPLAGLVRAKYDDPTVKIALCIQFIGMWPSYNGVALCSFLFHEAEVLHTLIWGERKKHHISQHHLTKFYCKVQVLQFILFKCSTD